MIKRTNANTFGISSIRVILLSGLLLFSLLTFTSNAYAESWRGLTISPENRCSPYRSKDYAYPQSVEPRIENSIGKIYSPYTGRCFTNLKQTDIEHIVARSEAHDSGLCAATAETRRRFASDLLNLTLASPSVNRHQKKHYDAAEWLPQQNRCWFAATVVAVKQKYYLTVDRREAQVLESILSSCSSMAMQVGQCANTPTTTSPTTHSPKSEGSHWALKKWDDNRNGRITCKEARRHRIAPVRRDHPAYAFMRDGDNDGVVCE